MKKREYKTVKVSADDGVLTISLARPEVRNAFNETLIQELTLLFEEVPHVDSIRIVVLKGEGPVFSAGGDLNWMQKSIQLSRDENLKDTTALTKMFRLMNECPKPLLGLIHGAAIGGGVGLVSVCDIVVATKETQFSLSEVRLGIVPACIGPFVLSKIGPSQCRALFMSAERFTAPKALSIGLIHEMVENQSELQKSEARILSNLKQCGPNAMAAAKGLIRKLGQTSFDESLSYVSGLLADLRVTPEGQEGLKAFLEKRKPNWIK